MIELAKKTLSTLKEFMDRADECIKTENTLLALMDLHEEIKKGEWQRGKLNKKAKTSRQGKKPERRSNHHPRLLHYNLGVREEKRDREERH